MRHACLLICLVFASCSATMEPEDAGGGDLDAGTGTDAGTNTDAGSGTDAGNDIDAGNAPDAGEDAGAIDAGVDGGHADGGSDAGVSDGGQADGGTPCDGGALQPFRLVSAPMVSATTTCGYSGASLTLPYIGAPPLVYRNAAGCGACLELVGSNRTLVGRVVDSGDFLDGGHLVVLDADFKELTDAGTGFAPVSWRFVPCDGAAPMRYRFQSSADPFVNFFPLDNAWPIAVAEARKAGTTAWTVLSRGPVLGQFNGTLPSTLGSARLELRFTDVHGHVVLDSVASLAAGTVTGTAQFPLTCK